MASLPQRVKNKLFQLVVGRRARPGGEDLVRLGSDYGGWWVPQRLLHPGVTAVCAGVGEDTTFDEALVAQGVGVWAVDPTPRAAAHIARRFAAEPALEADLRYLEVGLWDEDTTLRFYEPANPDFVSHSVVNLQGTTGYFEAECWTLERVLDHGGVHDLDILKLDIEGAEFAVLEHLLSSSVRPQAVLVEIDAPFPANRTLALLRSFDRLGYRLAHAEKWNLVLLRSPDD